MRNVVLNLLNRLQVAVPIELQRRSTQENLSHPGPVKLKDLAADLRQSARYMMLRMDGSERAFGKAAMNALANTGAPSAKGVIRGNT